MEKKKSNKKIDKLSNGSPCSTRNASDMRAAKIFLSNKLIRNHMQPVVCVCIAMQATQNRVHTVEINKSKWSEQQKTKKEVKNAHKTVKEYMWRASERARVSESFLRCCFWKSVATISMSQLLGFIDDFFISLLCLSVLHLSFFFFISSNLVRRLHSSICYRSWCAPATHWLQRLDWKQRTKVVLHRVNHKCIEGQID